MPGEVAHQPHRMLGNADVQHTRRIGHHDSVVTRLRLIDAVMANAEPSDECSASRTGLGECLVEGVAISFDADDNSACRTAVHRFCQFRLSRRRRLDREFMRGALPVVSNSNDHRHYCEASSG